MLSASAHQGPAVSVAVSEAASAEPPSDVTAEDTAAAPAPPAAAAAAPAPPATWAGRPARPLGLSSDALLAPASGRSGSRSIGLGSANVTCAGAGPLTPPLPSAGGRGHNMSSGPEGRGRAAAGKAAAASTATPDTELDETAAPASPQVPAVAAAAVPDADASSSLPSTPEMPRPGCCRCFTAPTCALPPGTAVGAGGNTSGVCMKMASGAGECELPATALVSA